MINESLVQELKGKRVELVFENGLARRGKILEFKDGLIRFHSETDGYIIRISGNDVKEVRELVQIETPTSLPAQTSNTTQSPINTPITNQISSTKPVAPNKVLEEQILKDQLKAANPVQSLWKVIKNIVFLASIFVAFVIGVALAFGFVKL